MVSRGLAIHVPLRLDLNKITGSNAPVPDDDPLDQCAGKKLDNERYSHLIFWIIRTRNPCCCEFHSIKSFCTYKMTSSRASLVPTFPTISTSAELRSTRLYLLTECSDARAVPPTMVCLFLTCRS